MSNSIEAIEYAAINCINAGIDNEPKEKQVSTITAPDAQITLPAITNYDDFQNFFK